MKSNKRAAMEMSVGTIVTIVLLMAVLILGIFLVQKIFSSAKGAIDLTDQQLKKEISKLFSADDSKRVILYPQTNIVEIKKGDSDEFAFIINNRKRDIPEEIFSYDVTVAEIAGDCQMSSEEAERIIKLGKSRSGIRLGSGDVLEQPIRVRLSVPETASLCEIRYVVNIDSSTGFYASSDVDLIIK